MRTLPRPLRVAGLCAWTAVLAGCGDDAPDAYGNFEATEVVVSAEAGGQLLRFEPDEGERLAAGATVGAVDTAHLVLQRRELAARREAARARAAAVGAQIDVLETQRRTARREYERAQRLVAAQAATAQHFDQAERDFQVLGEQIAATRAQRRTAEEEIASIAAQIAQVEERIEKSRIANPVAGTVLTTYAEAGELVQAGQPLYTIADLDTLTLRAYVSGAQLADVRIGQRVDVLVDAGDGELATLPGRVSWIASEAEFTPTPIQTREERTDQVYAIKVRVPNGGGRLKIGMPGEVVVPRPDGDSARTEQVPVGKPSEPEGR